MLSALQPLIGSKAWGMHVVSCYYHTEAIDANLWNGITQINGKVWPPLYDLRLCLIVDICTYDELVCLETLID